jgi:hypothetical protein
VRYWLSREVPEEYDAKTYIREYLAAHPEAIRHWRVDVWFKMLVRAVVLEITPIGIIFLSCLFLTMFLIKTKKGCYESLR